MSTTNESFLKRWVVLSPVIFSLHFLEEAPGFVDWANSHVDQHISQEFFLTANLFVMGVTTAAALMMRISLSTFSAAVLTLWLGFMMLANGCLHVFAGIYEQQYVPGLITAILLYIPYFVLLEIQLVRRKLLTAGAAIALTIVGSVPMVIQGYRVLFLGQRLW